MMDEYEYEYDFIDYFASICGEPSDSNVSYVWFTKYDREILVGGQVAAAFLLLFLLIGLPLNLTVMAVILWKKLYKTPSFMLMFNLMLSDLIYILLVIPVQLSTAITGEFWTVLGTDRAKCAACRGGGALSAVFLLISPLTICFMSFDRYLFIYKPMRHDKIITSVRVFIALIIMWLVSVVIAILPLVGFGHIIFDSLFLACSDDISGTASDTNLAYAVFINIVYAIPIILLVIFNLLVVYIVQKNIRAIYKYRRSQVGSATRRARSKELHTQFKKKRQNKELRLVRVFGGLLLANLVSWLPVITLGLVTVISRDTSLVPYPLHTVSVILFMMQVATHPIVEIALLRELKDPIKAFFCYFFRKKPLTSYSSSSGGDDTHSGVPCEHYHGDNSRCCACGCVSVLNAAILNQYEDPVSSNETELSSVNPVTTSPEV